MARQTKSESKLTEAADKTAALLQGLQSRLNHKSGTTPAGEPRNSQAIGTAAAGTSPETLEELDRQLQEYFYGESGKVPGVQVLEQIRDRVIDGVATRILAAWEHGDRRELGALENQVIDRVAERIMARMTQRRV